MVPGVVVDSRIGSHRLIGASQVEIDLTGVTCETRKIPRLGLARVVALGENAGVVERVAAGGRLDPILN